MTESESRERVGPFQIVILVLSAYVLIVMLVEATVKLSPEMSAILTGVDNGICLIFLGDFVYRFARAESKRKFMKWGWIDLISSIPNIDVLRWGRLVRVVRIIRVLRAVRSTRHLVSFFFRNRAQGTFAAVVLISITLAIFASIAILNLENVPEANIKTPVDALWWSIVTITTVGYGDKYPVTIEGRIIAVILMIAGISLFGTFTGLMASLFVEPEQQEESNEIRQLAEEVRALREKIEALERVRSQR
jgi:voltage-gated potassium channel